MEGCFVSVSPKLQLELPAKTLDKWQQIADIIAELIGVPAALIIRLVESDIEVFVSSKSDGNPYNIGDHEHFYGSGLYCETVIKTNNKLLVPNALTDDEWKSNPDIKLNMISYLGYPILLPNGEPFGTICVLDSKENAFSSTYESLIENFREVIQFQLELIYMNSVLGDENKNFSEYADEIRALRGILPICSFCKKIRDGEGNWNELEAYISGHSDATFSHGFCPECGKIHYGEHLQE